MTTESTLLPMYVTICVATMFHPNRMNPPTAAPRSGRPGIQPAKTTTSTSVANAVPSSWATSAQGPAPREGDDDARAEADHGRDDVGRRERREPQRPVQARPELRRQPAEQERERCELRERRELLPAVERRDAPRGQEHRDRERGADGRVDPEEVVALLLGEHRRLHRRLGETEVAEHLGDAGDRHDHGEESDVGRRQQARHDDDRRELDGEPQPLSGGGDRRPADCAAAESPTPDGWLAHGPVGPASDHGPDDGEWWPRMPPPTLDGRQPQSIACGHRSPRNGVLCARGPAPTMRADVSRGCTARSAAERLTRRWSRDVGA